MFDVKVCGCKNITVQGLSWKQVYDLGSILNSIGVEFSVDKAEEDYPECEHEGQDHVCKFCGQLLD